MKALNNRFQGTLHKVSGPLNRDVGSKQMKIYFAIILCMMPLQLWGEQPSRFPVYQVSREQLNTPVSPYDLYIEIATSGTSSKSIKCIVLHGTAYNPEDKTWVQEQAQVIPYSYTWQVLDKDGMIEREWLAYFLENRDMTRHTCVTLPIDELKRSGLVLYFEDIDGDGAREDAKFIVDMSAFNWEPTVETVYQSKQNTASNKRLQAIGAKARLQPEP